MFFRYMMAWLPMALIGIANGILRETTYGKKMPELRAHQISSLLGILFFGAYVWFLTSRWKLESASQALLIGFCWLAMTVAFEFAFGRLVDHREWSRLLRDYNLGAGRLWGVVLLWIAFAPYVCFLLRNRNTP
jgi:tryptophan-rich sensory protein